MRRHLTLLFGFILSAGSAYAIPLTWTLSGVVFTDGGTASGSFVYDFDSNQYSSINVVTTSGAAISGATYTFLDNAVPHLSTQVVFLAANLGDLTGTPDLALSPSAPGFTGAGGTVNIFMEELSCGNATCTVPAFPARFAFAGVATATPEPRSLLLFLFGITAIAVRRNQTRTP
jgi:hypothetical protein